MNQPTEQADRKRTLQFRTKLVTRLREVEEEEITAHRMGDHRRGDQAFGAMLALEDLAIQFDIIFGLRGEDDDWSEDSPHTGS